MKRKFREYQEVLLEDLQDHEFAAAYLNEALRDEDPRIFLLALKEVHTALGGEMTDLTRKTNISRESPKLSNIIALLNAVGFSLTVQPHKNKQ